MGDDYERLTLTCSVREIDVLYQVNWLKSGQWHIELPASEPLPITKTGY